MFARTSPFDDIEDTPIPKEGELYKIVDLHGHSFPLYYGYYEEWEREDPSIDPMPIYPDFRNKPLYTAAGFPFVTKMQDPCQHYQGKESSCYDCAECSYYLHGDELLGVCICPQNQQKE